VEGGKISSVLTSSCVELLPEKGTHGHGIWDSEREKEGEGRGKKLLIKRMGSSSPGNRGGGTGCE